MKTAALVLELEYYHNIDLTNSRFGFNIIINKSPLFKQFLKNTVV